MNRDDLILPLYYIDCPLIDDSSKADKDEIARLIVNRQFVDWRAFRHWRLGDLRPEVDKIAIQLLAAINRRNETDDLGRIQDTLPRGSRSPSLDTTDERNSGMASGDSRSVVRDANGFASLDGHEVLPVIETAVSPDRPENDFATGVQLYSQPYLSETSLPDREK